MTASVKGLVEIIKRSNESRDNYKLKVARLLYELQAAYNGLSKEAYSAFPDWHPDKVSKLEEEPSDEREDTVDLENKELFIKHHLTHGWNKTFNLGVLNTPLQEKIYGSSADADDCDFIR